MDTDLGSILNDTPAEPSQEAAVEQETHVEQQQAEPQQQEQTGEETTATPADKTVQDDPLERHRKGLEAAATAERRKRQEWEQKYAERERELEQMRQQLQQVQQRQAPQQDQEPQREDFGSDAEYLRAAARYEAKQLLAAERAEQQQQELRRQQEEQARDFQRKADETVMAGRKAYADFDAVINDGLAPFLNPVLQEALVHAGGHDVAYWLGKNPTEAARVSQMHPMQMVLEIGRLEAKVRAEQQPAKQAIPQTLTQERDARGQFIAKNPYSGPTPLNDILKR